MNIYIMIAILVTNVVAIGMVYRFIKKLNNKEKILFLAICIAISYIAVSVVYWLSGFGINETVHEENKNFITYMFVPLNMILFAPYIASKYMKLRNKKIKKQEFIKKCSIVFCIAVIVLVCEYFCFKNIQQNTIQISDEVKNTNENTQNEIAENEIVENSTTDNVSVNEQNSNEIVNEQIN